MLCAPGGARRLFGWHADSEFKSARRAATPRLCAEAAPRRGSCSCPLTAPARNGRGAPDGHAQEINFGEEKAYKKTRFRLDLELTQNGIYYTFVHNEGIDRTATTGAQFHPGKAGIRRPDAHLP